MAMNAGRSVHGAPLHAKKQANDPVLQIDGMVSRELALTPDDLIGLPRHRFLDLEVDRESTFLPETDWSGLRLDAVLAMAEPHVDAKWVRISAGPYATVVELAQAGDVLLCDQLGAEPIPVEKGGPWRLVDPRKRYNMSVKWVDRLTLSVEEPDNSAVRIAEARQRAREAKAAKVEADGG